MTTEHTDLSIDEYLRERLMPVEGSIPHISGIEMYGNSVPVGTVGGDLFEYINFQLRYDLDARMQRALKLSKEPQVAVIASASLPFGAPPLPGPMIVQKNEWLLWPPALLRTGPRIASGTLLRSAMRVLTSSLARSGWSFRALFALVT